MQLNEQADRLAAAQKAAASSASKAEAAERKRDQTVQQCVDARKALAKASQDCARQAEEIERLKVGRLLCGCVCVVQLVTHTLSLPPLSYRRLLLPMPSKLPQTPSPTGKSLATTNPSSTSSASVTRTPPSVTSRLPWTQPRLVARVMPRRCVPNRPVYKACSAVLTRQRSKQR